MILIAGMLQFYLDPIKIVIYFGGLIAKHIELINV